VKRTEPKTQTDLTRPISGISDLQTQSSHDALLSPPLPARADRLVKRTEPKTQTDLLRPISESSDLQTQSSHDAVSSPPLPTIADRPEERAMMGKRGSLEIAAFSAADRGSHRNALRLSDEDDGLMQSIVSIQNALSPKSTPSPTKIDRRIEPDVIVAPIFAEQKEIRFMDRRKDAFSEKSSSGSNSSIKVNIGRVEVRAAKSAPTPLPSPPKAVSTSRSGLSLDDYLKRRR
jgi:hypothetical protein